MCFCNAARKARLVGGLSKVADGETVGPLSVGCCDGGVGTEEDVCARGTGPIVELSVEATDLKCGEVCRKLDDAKGTVLGL